MRLFSWRSEDSIGNAKLDEQHREMYDLVQQLYDALARGDGVRVAGEVLTHVIGHCSEHFRAEEALMQKHRYPQLRTHQASHREFARTVLTFKRDLGEGKNSVVTMLLPYLQSWIKDHVQGTDHHFGEFLKAHADEEEVDRTDFIIKDKADAAGG